MSEGTGQCQSTILFVSRETQAPCEADNARKISAVARNRKPYAKLTMKVNLSH